MELYSGNNLSKGNAQLVSLEKHLVFFLLWFSLTRWLIRPCTTLSVLLKNSYSTFTQNQTATL